MSSLARAARGALLAGTTLLIIAPAAFGFTPEQEQSLQQIVEGYRDAVDYPALVAGVWQDGRGGFRTAVGEANLSTEVRRRWAITFGSAARRRR